MYLKIKCFTCGGDFHIYHRDFLKGSLKIRCPFCYTKMQKEALKRLKDAFYIMQDCNIYMEKQANEGGKPLFQAEIGAHFVPNYMIETDDREGEQ